MHLPLHYLPTLLKSTVIDVPHIASHFVPSRTPPKYLGSPSNHINSNFHLFIPHNYAPPLFTPRQSIQTVNNMALFKKFLSDEINTRDNAKQSYAKKIKEELMELYPLFEANINQMIAATKKEPLIVYKTKSKYSFIQYNGEPAFFHHDIDTDGLWLPTVRLIQKYPDFLPRVGVDRGAIPFVLKGAPVMSVGITSPGGKIYQDLEKDAIVGIYAENKEFPIAVGKLTVSTTEMKAGAKGEGVANLHYMGDGLWSASKF